MAITFDTTRKHIVLDGDNHSWAEIWSRWVDWHETNQQWPLAFSLVGGIALGSGLFIPPYFFLQNGWRVRPREADHNLTLTGNGFVEGGADVPVVPTLGTYRVNVNYTVPVQAQGVETGGSSVDVSAIVAAIRADFEADPYPVRVVKVNNTTLQGSGIPADPMRPA